MSADAPCGTVVREFPDDGDGVATLVMALPGVDGIRIVDADPTDAAAPGSRATRTVNGMRVADGLPVRVLIVTAPLEPAQRRRIRVEVAELEALLTHLDPDLVAPLLDHGVDAAGRPYLVLERGGPDLTGPLDLGGLRGAAATLADGLQALATQGLVGPPPRLRHHRGGLRLDTPLPPALAELESPAGEAWTATTQAAAVSRALRGLGDGSWPAAVTDLLDRAWASPRDLATALGSSTVDAVTGGRPLGSGYLLDRQIGRGATGVVWAGRQREDGRPVAVKLLRSDLAEDADVVTRFVRERRLLVGLRHPNLVRVHDLVAEGDALGIVMELVDGDDLRKVTARAPLSTVEIASVLAQTASALAAVHAAGLVHRDIKPENVLVTRRDGQLVALLSDFGIARPVEGSAGTDMIGTPTYVAPELVAGRPPEPAVDVYALGVMGYELFAGRPPFTAGTTEALLRAHLDQPVVRPAGVDDGTWQLLALCLAKAPAGRPTAAELAVRWAALAPSVHSGPSLARATDRATDREADTGAPFDPADREPTARSARPLVERPVESPPVRRRRRWPLLVAAAAVLGVMAGIGLAVARRTDYSTVDKAGTTPPATVQYVVPAGLRVVDPESVTLTWNGQAATLTGFQGYLVLDVSAGTARPVSAALAGDVTSFPTTVRPGRESCFLVIAVGVTASANDNPPPPVCVTTPTTS